MTTGALYTQLTREWAAADASPNNPNGATDPLVFVWMQGQSDAATGAYAAAYGTNLPALIAALRALVAPRVMKCVIAQVSSTMVLAGADATTIGQVRTAAANLVAGDGGLSVLVDETPFATFDNLHETQAGSIAHGVANGDAIASLWTTPGPLDIRIAGQSLCLPYTDTGTIGATLAAQAATRRAWSWLKWVASDSFGKRSPWRAVRQKKGPGIAPGGTTPTAAHRDLIGYDAAMAGRLMDLGYSPSMIHVAAGSSTLAVDWAP